MIQNGTVIDGKFRIRKEIGRGGMSIVYLAVDERSGKPCAVKAVRTDKSDDSFSSEQSFRQEIRLLGKLSHPALPEIYEVIESGDGILIVMEYIAGISLKQLLDREGARPQKDVLRWAGQLCEVLLFLHSQNPPVIYRDMKPSNIMRKPDGNVMLIDFGTVRERKNPERPEDTVCLGTRRYAAPEQFGGMGQSDERADIYSLGATLYHLLTGQPPSASLYGLKRIGDVRPAYAGTRLEAVIEKCTRREPEERYENCRELAAALARCERNERLVPGKQKRKKTKILASVFLTGFLCITGTPLREPKQLEQKRQEQQEERGTAYDPLIERAMTQNSMQEAKPFFLQALERDAGTPEIYKAMIRKAETDILAENGRLSGETAAALNECLTSTSSGAESNLSVLREEAPQTYTEILYEMGLWYFFLKSDTDAAKRTACENYFSRIREEPYLSFLPAEKQEMVLLLDDLGDGMAFLDGDLAKYGSREVPSDGRALFEKLQKIVEGNLIKTVGKEIYGIRIYEQAAFWINAGWQRFQEEGVSTERMLALLQTVDTGLDSLQTDDSSLFREEWKQAKETVENTRQLLLSEEAAHRKKGEKECLVKNTDLLQPV